MNKYLFTIVILLLTSYWKLSCTQQKEKPLDVPTIEETNKISAAIPAEATVTPQMPRKILVFSISWGYWHDVIPYGKKAFELLGKKTGAYDAVISDDIAMFEPQNLNQFDAVVFNNTNNEIFLPENFDSLSQAEQQPVQERDRMLKQSLVDFLAGGKGLAVIHAGVNSFRQWDEYGNIIGARFDNHPWNAGSTVTLKVDESDHPLVQAFKMTHFEVTDEIYQVTAPYSRDNLRVLLSLDTSRTNMKVKNIHRTDGDFAMSWIKSYGNGRVFYCALGHQKEIFWDPVILQHLLAGIQFVLGDLECDMRPSAEVKILNK